ncbi:MAG: adenylate/guanylate cyclase domain-containing protein [Vulcanococcus sp.]
MTSASPVDAPPPKPGLRLMGSWWCGRLRIAPTLAVVFCGTVTFATVVTGVFVMRSSLTEAHLKTAQRLKDATRLLAARLDVDELAALRDPSQTKSPSHERAHAALSAALDQIEGVRFIYTLRRNQGPIKDAYSRYVFVVDGTPYSSKDFTGIGVVMPTSDSTDALHRVWQTGRFEADRSFVSDQWGTWMSGYLPLLRRDGSFESVLGIDISADQVMQERQRMLHRLVQAYALSLLFALPLAALLGNRLAAPLRVLNQRLHALAQLDFNSEAQPIPSTRLIYEIQRISRSLVTLQAALADFSRYVPTSLVRQLVLNRQALQLEGESRPLAILFTDIRGFTTLSENMDPSYTLRLLNQYFGVIHRVAVQTQGVLDKYMGDSALVFWGAPDHLEHPARAAAEAALDCRLQLEQLNADWRAQGIEVQFDTCFGLAYGPVVVGNMGPHERVNYTIVGDHVNQAQRLERVNRRFGTAILASGEFVAALGDAAEDYLIVAVDQAQLRGFSTAVEVYEILARRRQATDQQQSFTQLFNAAREAHRQGRSDDGLVLLRQLPEGMQLRPYVQSLLQACSSAAEPLA